MEEWFEEHLRLSADEVGIILALALPLIALTSRRLRAFVGRLAERAALALGRPQARYRAWFVSEYGTLRNVYLKQVETLDLADSYISLSVQAEGEASGALVPAGTLLAPSGPRRIVILGDPGTGKSTLLKAYGSGVLRRADGNSELDRMVRSDEWPVLITLRQVADQLTRGGSLADHIVGVLAKRAGARNPRDLTRRLLRQGRLVVLLDGLDEVAQPGYDAVKSAVHAFVTADEEADLPTSMARVVLTCRRQNYRQIEDDWSGWFSESSYAIAALRDAEITRFVERRASQFTPERPADTFLADVRASGTEDLHRVPLVLTISIGLYTQLAGYEIPHSVDEFYDEMVRNLLRRHDFTAEGQLRMNRYRAEDKHRFLREFALHVARSRPSPFADFTYPELIDFCTARRRALPRLDDERAFVNEIIDRSGLLSPTNDHGHYAFAHRALHEHLAAAELARDPRPGHEFLLTKVADPQWRQVAVLFCGGSHDFVEPFLTGVAAKSLELACSCLATAEVSADVAGRLIELSHLVAPADQGGSSMLAAVVEAVKSPVPGTRRLALEAVRTSLSTVAKHTDPDVRRRIVADLFGGQSPMAGKILLAMSQHGTPEMAAAVARVTAALPDNDPSLVAPLWHCLGIPGVERSRSVAREIVGRLLVLVMDEECAGALERLPALQVTWYTPEDRAVAYPLKRGLSPQANLVTLLALGQALRTLDQVPRQNLYLRALTAPGRPLALIEKSPLWANINPHRWVRAVALLGFVGAYINVAVSFFALDEKTVAHGDTWAPACIVGVIAYFLIARALSRIATRRYVDHIYGAKFSFWCYLIRSKGAPLDFTRRFGAAVNRSSISANIRWRESILVMLDSAFPLIYAMSLSLLLISIPWVIPPVVVMTTLLLYWLPSTELCGEHTNRVLKSTTKYAGIYTDPESRHWVIPRQADRARGETAVGAETRPRIGR